MMTDRRARKYLLRGICLSLLGLILYTMSDSGTPSAPLIVVTHDNNTTRSSTSPLSNRRRRLPGCLIIGVRKAGTRALLKFLANHPAVRRAGKEVHFFNRPDHYRRGLAWYRARMPSSLPGQITVEKTPGYFHDAQVPLRILRYNRGVKLIVILRDPVIRVISDYTQTLALHRLKGEDYPRFESLVLHPETHAVDLAYRPIRLSLYSVHIRRWLRHFPRASLHFVSGENLIRQPWREMELVEKFLDLPVHTSQDHFYFNTSRGFYCLRSGAGVTTLMTEAVNSSGNNGCLSSSKGRRHPHVDPRIIRKLREFFQPYSKDLFRLVKQNFSWA